MKRLLFVAVFCVVSVLSAGVVAGNEIPVCRIGVAPQDLEATLDWTTQRLQILDQDWAVQMQSPSGRIVSCKVAAGVAVTVEKDSPYRALWVYACGNILPNKPMLSGKILDPPTEATTSQVEAAPHQEQEDQMLTRGDIAKIIRSEFRQMQHEQVRAIVPPPTVTLVIFYKNKVLEEGKRVGKGKSVTVLWSSENATECRFTSPVGAPTSLDTEGRISAAIFGQTLISVTCKGPGGTVSAERIINNRWITKTKGVIITGVIGVAAYLVAHRGGSSSSPIREGPTIP